MPFKRPIIYYTVASRAVAIAQLSIQVYLKDTIEKLIRMNNNRLPVRYEPIHAGHL